MTVLATVLLCLAAPAALAGRASQRPLRRSAVAFNECCKGSDIDMPKFLRAAKQYCELAAQFGRFAVPSASEVRRCIEKIEQAAHKLGGKGSRTNYKTMRALLQAEVALQHSSKCPRSQRPVRPATAPEAHPLDRGCPLGAGREPSPLGRVREATSAL